MAKIITDNQHYADIASAIRTKNETETLYKPSEMASAILEIQGGGDLNFEVVGGTSEPSNPKENTIWVDTNTEVIGWSFSATEPVDPAEGMVWVKSSDKYGVKINIAKDNVLSVYPYKVMQYESGSWIVKDGSKVFQSGKWIDIGAYLYYYGDQRTDITGGWKVGQVTANNAATLTFEDDHMILRRPNTTSNGAACTSRTIDLTEFDTAYVEYYQQTSGSSSVDFRASAGIGKSWDDYAKTEALPKDVRTIEALDISGVDRSAYITFRFAASTGDPANYAQIFRIWLV